MGLIRIIVGSILAVGIVIGVGWWTLANTVFASPKPATSQTQAANPAGNGGTMTPTATYTMPSPVTDKGTPTPVAGKTAVGASFNPNERYSQSCGPELNAQGGCVWDVGVRGNYSDVLGRDVVQVGIVKGVKISWAKGGKVADASSNGRCSLVILGPNSWFEDLNIVNANVTLYDVWPGDVVGWTKTLAVQNAYEQEKNYNCPAKKYEDIPQWGSPIQSPPCGTPGFSNCASSGKQQSSASATAQPPAQSSTTNQNCATVNCQNRRTSADSGGTAKFRVGEAVYGYTINMGGRTYQNCYLEKVSGDGTVTDGVVNYWPAEVAKARACSN
ncbi:hypothetical protein HY404_00495 [Candidatus Microgenomates bacterium]|nr:hypothetical protein [Candidatus Microgenomates bacterium]